MIALYYASAGAAFIAMVHGIVMALTSKGSTRLFWIYAAISADACAYQFVEAMFYTAPTIEAAVAADQCLAFLALIFLPLLAALVAVYTQEPRTRQYVFTVAILCIGFMVVNALTPVNIRYASVTEMIPIEMPWGERLHAISGKASILGHAVRILAVAIYLWGLRRAYLIFRKGARFTGAMLVAAILSLLMGLAAMTLHDLRILNSLYYGGFGYLFVILCFTSLIGREIFEAQQKLQQARNNLTEELKSHRTTREKLEYLAYHDVLTGLPNRVALLDRLEEAIAACQQNHGRLAILLVDIDRFEAVNDTLGHDIGDQLLSQAAHRLQAHVREDDFVARLNSDKFVVVASEPSHAYGAKVLAEQLLQALRLPFRVAHQWLNITASSGIAFFPEDGNTVANLLTAINTAVQDAKRQGLNQVQFYRTELSEAIRERRRLGIDMETALAEKQFELHFQPIVHAENGRISSLEALVRWRHPTDGLIQPDRFIPIAEETHLIIYIGNWVIEEACRMLAAWRSAGMKSVRVAINLSTHQLLLPDFDVFITSALSRYGLEGRDLELEITESVMMKDPKKSIAQLMKLRAHGVRLLIDDFGTGHSSLSYLKMLPVDAVKIDRSLVADICVDSNDAIICNTAISMANNLGLEAVAEGVETNEQAELLRALGCELLQGYLFSSPLPADQVPGFLTRNKAGKAKNPVLHEESTGTR